ncbi:unnamed protein product [Adineta steineri]|uniref:G-protein coupled receptors family 1 profile domain-containing protein n=1 Tax=Adineta steineri TaxID=433720 RepID=A0A819J5I0_9BILA|nr:unnamed protein product [Adineta steineri]
MESSIFNSTNITCPTPLFWTQEALDSRKARLIVCIIASFIHSIFWLQLAFCSSVRQTSMQWIYAYLITDMVLLFRFFLIYIVYSTSNICEPSRPWVLFIYYFDGTVDNYFNLLEVYILLALNICRYIQIVYNKNVYRAHAKLLILAHLCIYIFPLISLVIQFVCGWSQLVVNFRDSSQVTYTNIYIQVFNVITAFVLPISLNITVIYLSMRHVRLTSTLQQGQHHVSAREKYNRSLVIQFLVFYTIWLSLWSPNIIVYQISIDGNVTSIVRLLNFIGITLDPIIIAALDVRFWQEWRKVFMYLKNNKIFNQPNGGRIRPATTNVHVISAKTPRLQTTAL